MNENGIRTRRSPTLLSDSMKKKVATEYLYAKREDRREIAKKYNISTGAVTGWIRDGNVFKNPSIAALVPVPRKEERSLDDLLWEVVIKARESGIISTVEAKRLLELVR
jgi:hypothetical protein